MARVEPVVDLAVVRVAEPLEPSVAGVVATDGVPIGVGVVVTDRQANGWSARTR